MAAALAQMTHLDRYKGARERETVGREKECRFEMDDGHHLSLYHLRKKRVPDYTFQDATETGLYKYYFNFCAPTVMTCNGEEDALAIQKIDDDCIAVLARGGVASVSYLNEDASNKGVRLTYECGDACGSGPRSVEHILKCDPNIHHEIESVEEGTDCSYIVTSRTKYTCKLAATRQDLSSWEDKWHTPESLTEERRWSLWDNSLIRLLFFVVLGLLIVNIYLFYKNQRRDLFRNYSSVQPVKDKIRGFFRVISDKLNGR